MVSLPWELPAEALSQGYPGHGVLRQAALRWARQALAQLAQRLPALACIRRDLEWAHLFLLHCFPDQLDLQVAFATWRVSVLVECWSWLRLIAAWQSSRHLQGATAFVPSREAVQQGVSRTAKLVEAEVEGVAQGVSRGEVFADGARPPSIGQLLRPVAELGRERKPPGGLSVEPVDLLVDFQLHLGHRRLIVLKLLLELLFELVLLLLVE